MQITAHELKPIYKRFRAFYHRAVRAKLYGIGVLYRGDERVGFIATDGIALIWQGERYDPKVHQLAFIDDHHARYILENESVVDIPADYNRHYPDPSPLWDQVNEIKKPFGEFVITPRHKQYFRQWYKTERTGYRRHFQAMDIVQHGDQIEYHVRHSTGYHSNLFFTMVDRPKNTGLFMIDIDYFEMALAPDRKMGSDITILNDLLIEIQNPTDTVLIMGLSKLGNKK